MYKIDAEAVGHPIAAHGTMLRNEWNTEVTVNADLEYTV